MFSFVVLIFLQHVVEMLQIFSKHVTIYITFTMCLKAYGHL